MSILAAVMLATSVLEAEEPCSCPGKGKAATALQRGHSPAGRRMSVRAAATWPHACLHLAPREPPEPAARGPASPRAMPLAREY